MKNIIKKIGKSVAIQIVAFSIIVGGVAIAISFPTSTPIGQMAGGKFMEYFNKIFTDCGPGKVLQGYDFNFNKICVSFTTPATSFTCGSNITVGGFTYTTRIGLDGKCWTSTNMKHTPTSGNSWCYDNNPSNCNTYGRLYDWSAATDSSVCGSLGTGWILPTDAQYTALTNSGATGWNGNKLGSLVSTLPGIRDVNGIFKSLGGGAYLWSSTNIDSNDARGRVLLSYNSDIINYYNHKIIGFSVLCINPTITGTPAPVSVNGVCGTAKDTATTTAPSTNLCTSGTSTSVISNTPNFTWSCNGTNGTPTNCSAPRQYTVTFNGNGGNTPSFATKKVTYDTAIGNLPTTSKNGSTFDGWFTSTTGGTQLTTNTLVTSNVTYYARFTTTFTCESSTVSAGGFTYTTKKVADGKCWTSMNMKHTPSYGLSSCYDDNISNCNTYGRLYDWNAAMTVCQQLGTGWALPTKDQWQTLINVGATGRTGNKLYSLVNSIPGYRTNTGIFSSLGILGYWWSSTESSSTSAWYRTLQSINGAVFSSTEPKGQGYSVLCIKN